MILPRHEEAPGADRRRGPKKIKSITSSLSIAAPAEESTRNRCAFCQFMNEY